MPSSMRRDLRALSRNKIPCVQSAHSTRQSLIGFAKQASNTNNTQSEHAQKQKCECEGTYYAVREMLTPPHKMAGRRPDSCK